MAARTRRGSGSTAGTKENGSKDDWLEKRVDAVREVTNAAEEDIRIILAECDGDVDEATSRLIDSTCSAFVCQALPSLSVVSLMAGRS